MDHRERFYATIERRTVDRPASWLGLPDPKAVSGLLRHFKVENLDRLREAIDDDVYPVELPYHSSTADAIYMAFDFAGTGHIDPAHRTLNSPGVFYDVTDPARVDDFDWPDPARYISPEECRMVVNRVLPGRAVLGVIWSAFFQDAWAAFGMENACIQMIQAPEMFEAVLDRIVEFYLRANEIFYKATPGKLDAVLIGNDYGAQTGTIISPESIRTFAIPRTQKLVEQAKSYGLKVIHHSCGSVHDILPDLIAIGVDAVHPIQALAAGMSAEQLAADFSDRVSFVGGVDAQLLLVNGTPAHIEKRVSELKTIFPTGLVISPSHEAILPDVDPANIEALFKAVKAN